jgi:hypothetical protein
LAIRTCHFCDESGAVGRWDIFILLIILYTFFTVPLRLAFDGAFRSKDCTRKISDQVLALSHALSHALRCEDHIHGDAAAFVIRLYSRAGDDVVRRLGHRLHLHGRRGTQFSNGIRHHWSASLS